jgi:Putative zincin peptidase
MTGFEADNSKPPFIPPYGKGDREVIIFQKISKKTLESRQIEGVQANTNYTISSLKANLIAIPVALMIIFLFVLTYILVWSGFPVREVLRSPYLKLQVFLPMFVVLVLLHEAIHWISFLVFGKVDKKYCKLGFQWRTITPYAHCSVPMKASVYRISLFLPILLLGIIPSFYAIISGLSWLLVYGIVFTITGGGDFIILWLMRKVEKDRFVKDHPSRCGCELICSPS